MPRYANYAIILGAGASYGSMAGATTPPLDSNFLKVAGTSLSGRSRSVGDRNAWKGLIKALKKAGIEKEHAISQRLEQLATYLEARSNMSSLQLGRGQPKRYAEALDRLKDVICRTLEARNGTNACKLHRLLFERVNPSAVITFNYDLIADQTLLDLGKLNWAHSEYAGSKTMIVKRKRPYVPRRNVSNRVRMLKLHGSMNWNKNRRGGSHSLVCSSVPTRSLQYKDSPKDPLIVPPIASKIDIHDGALRRQWALAVAELRTAPGWIIWGYSFPATDTVTQVLCRTALARHRKHKPVIVVNPDFSTQERVKQLVGKVRIEQWSSIERFLLEAGALSI